jgi:hypothetical protein
MSKGIMEETKSVLYETVQISEWKHFRHDRERDTFSDSFNLTKYVRLRRISRKLLTFDGYRFVCSRHLISNDRLERCFPNARAIITLAKHNGQRAPMAMKVYYGTEDKPFEAQLRLYHPTSLDTLSSLFRYPAKWGNWPPPYELHLIEAISQIDLIGGAALLGGRFKPADLLRWNWIDRCHVNAQNCHRHDLNIQGSLSEMMRFAPKLPVKGFDGFCPPVCQSS